MRLMRSGHGQDFDLRLRGKPNSKLGNGEVRSRQAANFLRQRRCCLCAPFHRATAVTQEETNKAIVGRWFTNFWGKPVDLAVVDELVAPDTLLQ
jgi:hypothetical protein